MNPNAEIGRYPEQIVLMAKDRKSGWSVTQTYNGIVTIYDPDKVARAEFKYDKFKHSVELWQVLKIWMFLNETTDKAIDDTVAMEARETE